MDDSANKVALLNGEVHFNNDLLALLEGLQAVQKSLDLVQRLTLDDRWLEAVELFNKAGQDLSSLSMSNSTRISGILEAKVADIRSHLVKKLSACWKAYITVDPAKFSIRLKQTVKGAEIRCLLICHWD